MPPGVPLAEIYGALRATLLASPEFDSLLARDVRLSTLPALYTEGAVPDGATMPYVTMGAATQIPAHRMGSATALRYGWDCTVQLKAVGAGRGEDENVAILDCIGRELYDGRDLTAAGSPGSPGLLITYATAWCDEWVVQPTIVSILNGVPIRETLAILRVQVHD
jgi:hypothetical protein